MHILRHYDVVVLVPRVVDKSQGVSAFVFSGLLKHLDFLCGFTTLAIDFCKVLLVNQLDSNFDTSFLVTR